MNTAVLSDTLSRLGNLMVSLGGGIWREIDDDAERSTYQSAGFFVLLNAVIAWGVAMFAVVGLSELSLWVALPVALVCGLLVGAFGRTLTTAVLEPGRTRVLGEVTRAAVAVLIGIVVGELAALAIFTGPVNRQLNVEADTARASVSTSDRGRQLEQLRDDRARLDERVSASVARRDEAQIVARCEFNPGPECPSNRITGVPGRGQEASLAETALANAERDLAAARAERAAEGPQLDTSIARIDSELEVDRDTAEALARADNGLDARWRAMHTYTTENAVAMLLRLGIVTLFVLLNLLPLLLRSWRGQTELDRRVAARRLRNRAEEEADTAIALKRAEVRATRELRLQEELLQAPLVEGTPVHRIERAPDGDRRRVATVTPKRELLGLPSGKEAPSGDNLPVLASDRDLEQRGALDALPGPLPQMAKAFGDLVRPLVPAQVARLAEGAPKPLKTARTLLEEVEEFQFSLLRKRKVTITEEKSDDAEPEQEQPETGEKALRRSAMATRILDFTGDRRNRLGRGGESAPALTAAEQRARRELPLGDRVRQLTKANRRELPPAGRRELPPGSSSES